MGGHVANPAPLRSICRPLSRSPVRPEPLDSRTGSTLPGWAQPVPNYYSACVRSHVLLLGHYEALISQAFSCPLVYIIKN